MQDWSESESLAVAAAQLAGRQLRDQHTVLARAEKRSQHDVKLLGDRAAEASASRLLVAGSGYPVFSEESGWIGREDNGESLPARVWVLDPLDGSANFSRGLPLSAVSIALCENGVPTVGVIYDFWRDEMFVGSTSASGESAAACNGAPMSVSDISERGKAILATGFPAALDYSTESLGDYVQHAQAFHKVRSLGTAALMLAYVASGRIDVYYERDVRFWDVAAGIALVRAAGGRTDIAGAEVSDDLGRKVELMADNGRLGLSDS